MAFRAYPVIASRVQALKHAACGGTLERLDPGFYRCTRCAAVVDIGVSTPSRGRHVRRRQSLYDSDGSFYAERYR